MNNIRQNACVMHFDIKVHVFMLPMWR
jgi:hypothetical protein